MQRIFVGDVQGCAAELIELVARATDAFGSEFALWVAGDLVNRGPGNLAALELVRGLVDEGRAEFVLGNHEIHLISAFYGLRPLSENDSIGDVLESPEVEAWIDWLRARPLVVRGMLGEQPFAMLHASAGPGWSLDELVARGEAVSARLSGDRASAEAFLALDPETDPVRNDLARLTRGRAGDDDGWSSREPDSPEGAWHVAWARHEPTSGVLSGPWARQGLNVADGLRGLDTGCVHHGRGRDGFLTAWLPESLPSSGAGRPFDAPDDRFWQIPAKRRYYYPSQDRT